MAWTLETFEPDYLGGIQATGCVRSENDAPVAYCFAETEGRVLAAAPELLEAVKALVAVLGGTPMPDCAAMNRLIAASSKARTAIAKATGEA